MQAVGLGCEEAQFRVHMGNRPPLSPFAEPDGVMPLLDGEIATISAAGGNGWRKVFSVFAKLCWTLAPPWLNRQGVPSWQAYRDGCLLQTGSDTALLFSDPVPQPAGVQILMGKAYGLAAAARAGIELHWVDAHFAISADRRTVLCPYFDYRQLTNARIETLTALLKHDHH
ncbi:hypothetical protein KUV89_18755 [Marinobacter hydrocarbonoclasticus]|nr:hypothetical protein [Marinobacter nauticus]